MTDYLHGDTVLDRTLRMWLEQSGEHFLNTLAVPLELKPQKGIFGKKIFNMDQVESREERVIRVLLEESDKLREGLLEKLKPGELICNHLRPHVIPVFEGTELDFRMWMDKMGWFRLSGYCPVYYPMWLRHSYRVVTGNKLLVLEEEPAAFNEGGKWVPESSR